MLAANWGIVTINILINSFGMKYEIVDERFNLILYDVNILHSRRRVAAPCRIYAPKSNEGRRGRSTGCGSH